uniref:Uncharacterized protein n=1 Tax=Palpitomonas bilix TaxID=652834 RepID=A0A7S3LUF0_9EUKA|mmetsp:Transcript_47347/g.122481  ORF Transcript_47347/g.122481 Transcript_47347/m.122481 type:complete len:638 (+) Transcript_47347:85-1998(+)
MGKRRAGQSEDGGWTGSYGPLVFPSKSFVTTGNGRAESADVKKRTVQHQVGGERPKTTAGFRAEKEGGAPAFLPSFPPRPATVDPSPMAKNEERALPSLPKPSLGAMAGRRQSPDMNRTKLAFDEREEREGSDRSEESNRSSAPDEDQRWVGERPATVAFDNGGDIRQARKWRSIGNPNMDAIKAQCNMLEATLMNERDMNARVVRQYEEKIIALQRDNDILVSKLEVSDLRVREGRAGLEEKLRLLSEELEWIRRENKEASTIRDNENTMLRQEVAELNNRIGSEMNNANEWKQKALSLQQQKGDILRQFEQLQQDQATQQHSIGAKASRIEELEDRLLESSKRVEQLKREKQTAIDEASAYIEELLQRIETLEQQRDAEADRYRSELRGQEKGTHDLLAKNVSLSKEVEYWKTRLETEVEGLKSKLSRVRIAKNKRLIYLTVFQVYLRNKKIQQQAKEAQMHDQMLALRRQTEEKLSQLDSRLRNEQEESSKKAKSLSDILSQKEQDWAKLRREYTALADTLREEIPILKRRIALLEIEKKESVAELGRLRIDAATSRTLFRRLLSERFFAQMASRLSAAVAVQAQWRGIKERRSVWRQKRVEIQHAVETKPLLKRREGSLFFKAQAASHFQPRR